METIIELELKIKVPLKRADEVSQKLIDLITELDVFDGGTLKQSDVTVNI